MHAGATHRLPASGAKKTKSPPTSHSSGEWSWREWAWTEETQDGRPENLGSRDGTDPSTPVGAGAQHSFTPKPEVASQYHTVISRARHLPWEPGRAAASKAGAGREKVHPTRNIEARPSRRAEHGAGATLEVAR